MYKNMKYKANLNAYKSQIVRKPVDKGESIEEMLRRLTANKEPIPQNVPPIYTVRENGVIPDTDIRHDRWDTAYEATDKFTASKLAQSADKGEVEGSENGEGENEGREE